MKLNINSLYIITYIDIVTFEIKIVNAHIVEKSQYYFLHTYNLNPKDLLLNRFYILNIFDLSVYLDLNILSQDIINQLTTPRITTLFDNIPYVKKKDSLVDSLIIEQMISNAENILKTIDDDIVYETDEFFKTCPHCFSKLDNLRCYNCGFDWDTFD